MKLPNFIQSMEFNSLKTRMGIPVDHLAPLSAIVVDSRLSEYELDRLTSEEGLDVAFDEISILRDGTLAYKGRRVLLYIRDLANFGRRDDLPKYHLANCKVLQDAQHSGRFGRRYVIANSTNGMFQINRISGGRITARTEQLNVCQVCMCRLRMEGFSWQLPKSERRRRVEKFRPEKFFDLYPIDLHSQLPQYDANEAPLNKYSNNFQEISSEFKALTQWHCQGCGADLSRSLLRKYLHTHHRNGDKSDNTRTNLRALCIECHAKQPQHSHVKNTPAYREFKRLMLTRST